MALFSKVHIMSRQAIENMSQHAKYDGNPVVIISITDFDEPQAQILAQSWIHQIIRLRFDDVYEDEPHAMTHTDAIRITKFAADCTRKNYELWVQCEGGVARSAAVAAGLLTLFGEDDEWIWRDPKYYPNIYVYRLMLGPLWVIEEKDIRRKQVLNVKAYKAKEEADDE